MLSDSSLRTRIVYDIAVRYATPLWRAGTVFRGGCVAGLWVLLAWFPAGSVLRGAAQLVMVSAGVSMAWVQLQPGLLDRLESGRLPGLSRTVWHLRGARGRATADLAGILESLGIVAALLLYVGPFAVRPLPAGVYLAGLVLVTGHLWSAYSQVMTDSSWYNPEAPANRRLVVLRPWIPVIIAAILFVMMISPRRLGLPWQPAGLAIPLLLAGSTGPAAAVLAGLRGDAAGRPGSLRVRHE